MRKLVLFGLLGTIFGSALLLEHVFARKPEDSKLPDHKAVLLIGGGVPRSIPATAPELVPDEELQASGQRSKSPPTEPRPRQAPADPTPPDPNRVHIVAAKETLWTIAAAELGSGARWPEIAEWNGIAGDAPLRVGAKLRLSPARRANETKPAASDVAKAKTKPAADATRTHKVAKGESLSKIAALYLGDAGRWREIQRLNQIADPAAVGEGQVLKIPER